MLNKKIVNATEVEHNNIKYKSKLEKSFHKTLLEAGFTVEYESVRFVLFEGFKPTVPFYTVNKKKKVEINDRKQSDITYTPDFIVRYKDYIIIIEAKGFENDVFPVKKKMFRRLLENLEGNYMYFELFTKKQLLEAIEIIKKL